MNCPHCRREHDVHAAARKGTVPKDGDISMCYGCGLLAFYVGNPPTELRKPTSDELTDLLADPGVQSAIMAYHGREGGLEGVLARFRASAGPGHRHDERG